MNDTPLLEIHGLCKYFPVTRGSLFRRAVGQVKAVDGVSLSVYPGETVGLVGESGCGKTTLGRCILKLETPSDGEIRFQGENVFAQDRGADLRYRRQVQAVFQDPFSSLNPRMRVEELIAEPLLIHREPSSRQERRARVLELIELCGLPQRLLNRYPHEMSGGQRQRVGIARAIALNPRFIVCDEAVSALDVSIQAQVINLLEDLRNELGLTYLFIAHDLAVVRHLCQRVAVMYLGKIVEVAPSDTLFSDPQHPYTRALLDAVPVPDPVLEAERPHQPLAGEIPSPLNPPTGCVFHPRCPLAVADCQTHTPALRTMGPQHRTACTQVHPISDSTAYSPEIVHENPL